MNNLENQRKKYEGAKTMALRMMATCDLLLTSK